MFSFPNVCKKQVGDNCGALIQPSMGIVATRSKRSGAVHQAIWNRRAKSIIAVTGVRPWLLGAQVSIAGSRKVASLFGVVHAEIRNPFGT